MNYRNTKTNMMNKTFLKEKNKTFWMIYLRETECITENIINIIIYNITKANTKNDYYFKSMSTLLGLFYA